MVISCFSFQASLSSPLSPLNPASPCYSVYSSDDQSSSQDSQDSSSNVNHPSPGGNRQSNLDTGLGYFGGGNIDHPINQIELSAVDDENKSSPHTDNNQNIFPGSSTQPSINTTQYEFNPRRPLKRSSSVSSYMFDFDSTSMEGQPISSRTSTDSVYVFKGTSEKKKQSLGSSVHPKLASYTASLAGQCSLSNSTDSMFLVKRQRPSRSLSTGCSLDTNNKAGEIQHSGNIYDSCQRLEEHFASIRVSPPPDSIRDRAFYRRINAGLLPKYEGKHVCLLGIAKNVDPSRKLFTLIACDGGEVGISMVTPFDRKVSGVLEVQGLVEGGSIICKNCVHFPERTAATFDMNIYDQAVRLMERCPRQYIQSL